MVASLPLRNKANLCCLIVYLINLGTIIIMVFQIERERRFLCSELPKNACRIGVIHQAYLFSSKYLEIRVRAGVVHSAALKIRLGGAARVEIECKILKVIARRIVRTSRFKIEKVRYTIEVVNANGGFSSWEIDKYLGRHTGLITAEREYAAREKIEIPCWAGDEITGDEKFSNRFLAHR